MKTPEMVFAFNGNRYSYRQEATEVPLPVEILANRVWFDLSPNTCFLLCFNCCRFLRALAPHRPPLGEGKSARFTSRNQKDLHRTVLEDAVRQGTDLFENLTILGLLLALQMLVHPGIPFTSLQSTA
jgi:hypothetical protein